MIREPKIVSAKHLPEGWKNDPRYRYVGRGFVGQVAKNPSAWGGLGNPFKPERGQKPGDTLAKFEPYCHQRIEDDWAYRKEVEDLHQFEFVVCWCAGKQGLTIHDPHVCHAQTLVSISMSMLYERSGESGQTPSPAPPVVEGEGGER